MHVVVGIVGKMVRRAFLVGDLLVFGSSCIFPFLKFLVRRAYFLFCTVSFSWGGYSNTL